MRAVTTTRHGLGVSQAPFDHLNLGARCGDDPAAVAENRRLLADALDDNLIHCAQEAGFVAALSKPLPRARFGPLLERILQGDHTFTHTFCPA